MSEPVWSLWFAGCWLGPRGLGWPPSGQAVVTRARRGLSSRWCVFAPCGLLILGTLARAVACGGLKVPKCSETGQASVGLQFSRLWVVFAVVLLAIPQLVWEGATHGYGYMETGTNGDYHCTIYQGVEFVRRCYLVILTLP